MAKTPDNDLRRAYYSASDGYWALNAIAEKIKTQDPEFHKLVEDMGHAQQKLLEHMNAKYNWD